MRIHKEGLHVISGVFAFLIVILALITYATPPLWLLLLSYAVALGFFCFVARFFRVPKREIKQDENIIYAPADGEIVVVEEVDEKKYFNERRMQISIFMSAFDVHVNSYPISGKIIRTDYSPGKHLIAWYPKSSEFNEHTCTLIENDKKERIMVKQIAGLVARRIVCFAKPEMQVRQGDELGIIKLGSRVDIFLPLNTKIEVKMGDKVRSKQTILARFD